MSFLVNLAFLATGIAIYLILRIIILPKLKMNSLKKKYGEKVIVMYNFGSGLITEKKKSLKKEGDSLGVIRKLLWNNPKAQVIIHNNLSGQVAYTFIDPELIKQVHQQPENFVKQAKHPVVISLFSKSILYQSGKEWQVLRQFFGKFFNFQEIKNYFQIIKETSDVVFGSINNDFTNHSLIEIQVIKTCERVTSEVIFKAFFGFNSSNFKSANSNESNYQLAQEIKSIITDSIATIQNNKLAFVKFLIFKKKSYDILPLKCERDILDRLKKVKEECDKYVQLRKQQLLKDPTLYQFNFLDLYLKEIIQNKNEDIKEESIIDNFLALVFAGTDTTANMVGTSIYYLSQNPEMQKKAREEILDVLRKKQKFQNVKDLLDSIAFEDISSLNYLNSVLKESLRLIPPAVNVFPRKVIQAIKIGEFQLNKGNSINTNFICGNYNPEVFTNPEQFDPTRWMNEKDFTPFSLGPRNCIGQHLAMIEGKCMLAFILLNFEIIPNPSVKVRKEFKATYRLQPDNLVYFKKLEVS